jgi:hypothetical protein
MRDCRSPLPLTDNRHFFAVDGTAADVADDLPGERGWHTPNDCGIGTLDPAQCEIPRKCPMRGLGLGNDHQTARVFIEAMDNTRSANPADPGEARAAMADQGVYQCPVWVSGRRVDNQPGGLVDDDQVPILKPDFQRNRLCDRRRISIIGKKYDEILAAANPQRRVAQRCPFTCDMAGVDEPFEPGARESREMARQSAVKTLPGFVGAGKDGRRGAAWPIGFSAHDRAFGLYRGKKIFPD